MTFRIHARSDRQVASGMLHGLDRVEHQVHEDLLKLYRVRQDIRSTGFQFGMNGYAVPIRFAPQQNGHFFNYFLHVDELAFCWCSRCVESSQTVDNVGCTIYFLLNSGRCRPHSIQLGRIMSQPSQKGVCIRDRGGNGLLNFMSQCCGQLSHQIDAVDACQISLQLPQSLPLQVGVLSVCYIDGDADVFTHFARRIVVPNRAQKTDCSIAETNSVFTVLEVRLSLNSTRNTCPHRGRIVGMNSVKKYFKRQRALAGFKSMQAINLVRHVMNLPCVKIRCPATRMSKTLRLREVCPLPSQ